MAVPSKFKCVICGMSPKFYGTCAIILEVLALAALVLGIISGVKYEAVFSLWSTEYFLISIALFIWGLWVWLVGYFAAKEE